MFELLKKSVFATVGLALLTREKIEDVAKKIAEDAKLSESEGKQFVDELLKKSEETRLAIEKLINEKIDTALNKMNIPTRSEVNAFDIRLRKLEASATQDKTC